MFCLKFSIFLNFSNGMMKHSSIVWLMLCLKCSRHQEPNSNEEWNTSNRKHTYITSKFNNSAAHICSSSSLGLVSPVYCVLCTMVQEADIQSFRWIFMTSKCWISLIWLCQWQSSLQSPLLRSSHNTCGHCSDKHRQTYRDNVTIRDSLPRLQRLRDRGPEEAQHCGDPDRWPGCHHGRHHTPEGS